MTKEEYAERAKAILVNLVISDGYVVADALRDLMELRKEEQ